VRAAHAAVILAVGAELPIQGMASAGLEVTDHRTGRTSLEGLFATGACCTAAPQPLIRVIASARAAADAAVRHARGEDPAPPVRPIALHYGPLADEEKAVLWAGAGYGPPTPGPIAQASAARAEALRCLVCGCRDNDRCRLRQVAAALGARTDRYVGQRRRLMRDDSHPQVVFESHKCILCGACVEAGRGHQAALAMIGRGMDARVAAPYDAPWGQALGEDAAALADVCPTSAIHRRPRYGGKEEREES
jgi:formate dehydrogenase major subunit